MVVLAAIILAGCAPKVPDGLKAVIEKSHPNAKYLEARQGTMPGQINVFWCVAYKPDPSQDMVLVEIYYPETWLQPNFAWAREIILIDIEPDGGWCYRMN